MKSILFMALLCAIQLSCSDTKLRINEDKPSIIRAKVLENNTITMVTLSPAQKNIYRALDTVWINLRTGLIDDTCDTAMKCVLYSAH